MLVAMSLVTYGELEYGALKSQNKQQALQWFGCLIVFVICAADTQLF
jgi:predicted nucleic acid-binding protein